MAIYEGREIREAVRYYKLDDIPEDVRQLMTVSEKDIKEDERFVVVYLGGKADLLQKERLTTNAMQRLEVYKRHLLKYPEHLRSYKLAGYTDNMRSDPYAWERVFLVLF